MLFHMCIYSWIISSVIYSVHCLSRAPPSTPGWSFARKKTSQPNFEFRAQATFDDEDTIDAGEEIVEKDNSVRAPELDPSTNPEVVHTIAKLQEFVANSPDHVGRLVMIGDSTMAGLAHTLLDLNPAITRSRWLVHATNDRPRPVNLGVFSSDGGEWHDANGEDYWIYPGKTWTSKDAATFQPALEAVARVESAQSILHGSNCSWGGGIETYIYTQPPLTGLVFHHWSYLPEYGYKCWDDCMAKAMARLSPNAIVWNVGLHLLNHDFDEETCAKRQVPGMIGCNNYTATVRNGLKALSRVSDKVVWRSINNLCNWHQEKIVPKMKAILDKWSDASRRYQLEAECHSNCSAMGHKTSCYNFLMSSRTTELMYNQSKVAVASLSDHKGIYMLDAFESTRNCCYTRCDKTEDGEHYFGLDFELLHRLSQIIAQP